MQVQAVQIEKSAGSPRIFGDFFSLQAFCRYSHWGLVAYCFFAALSIAASQVIVVSLIVYWLAVLTFREGEDAVLSEEGAERAHNKLLARVSVPMISWCFISLIAAIVGIDFFRALPEVLKTFLYMLFPFCVSTSLSRSNDDQDVRLGKIRIYLFVLIISQCIAAVHSVFSAAAGFELPPKVPGPVTESGQLVLIIPCLMGLMFLDFARPSQDVAPGGLLLKQGWLKSCFLAIILFSSLLMFVWPEALLSNDSIQKAYFIRWGAGIIALLILLPGAIRFLSQLKDRLAALHKSLMPGYRTFLWCTASVLFAVLLINLKRGPWMGVLVSLAVLGFFLSPRLLVFAVLIALLIPFSLSPVSERLSVISHDFFVQGGRMNMWGIGLEFVQRFPLGLGLDNASYMQKLDSTLPYLHRHMHNNLLNVAVENGLIGLAVYLWWMIAVLGLSLAVWRGISSSAMQAQQVRILAITLGCALFGWQVAGLVEYNFGDGEIRLIAFFFMGLLFALSSSIPPEERVDEARSSKALPDER